MKFILSILFVFQFTSLIQNAQAKTTHCYVVSGSEEDKVGSFKHDSFLDKSDSNLYGQKCKIFNDWESLEDHFNKTSSQLDKDKDQIFIFQGAHGNPGGEALCNDMDVSPEEIIDVLGKICSQYQTGFVNGSCYSGDILKKMIVKDKKVTPSLSNLCMITASVFGNPTIATGSQEQFNVVKAGMNMEQLFHYFSDGLISSAPWEDSGVAGYFRNEEEGLENIASGISLLNELTQMKPATANCELALELCKSEHLSDENMSTILYDDNPLEVALIVMEKFKKENPEDKISQEEKILKLERILGQKELRCRGATVYTPLNVLRNFTHKGLEWESNSPVDKERKKACQNFVFEKGSSLDEKAIQERKLYLAAKRGDLEEVQALISQETPVTFIDKWNNTALNYAVDMGDFAMVETLVKNKADKENKGGVGGTTPLNKAADLGNLKIVKLLIEQGADIEGKNMGGFTPLAQAVYKGRMDVVNFLLERGADPTALGILHVAENPPSQNSDELIKDREDDPAMVEKIKAAIHKWEETHEK